MLQLLMMMGKKDFDIINQQGGSMEAISRYQIDMIRNAPVTTVWTLPPFGKKTI